MAFVHDKYLLIKNKIVGQDLVVDVILSGKAEDKELLDLYQRARTIHLAPVRRRYVEAALLASSNLEEIAKILEISLQVLQMYEDIFFNVKDLDRLGKLEFISSVDDHEAKSMYLWALSQGLDFISFRLGKASNISPVKGLEDMYQMACWKAKEALFSNNTSEGSKQATIWVKLSMDLAKILKAWVSDTDAAKQDIELALEKIEPKFRSFQDLDMGAIETAAPTFIGLDSIQ